MNLYDGRVRIPTSMPGLEILLSEFAAFPEGTNDDLIDGLSIVAADMERVVGLARRAARGERV
jgi:phage terminase large subunit-like protein